LGRARQSRPGKREGFAEKGRHLELEKKGFWRNHKRQCDVKKNTGLTMGKKGPEMTPHSQFRAKVGHHRCREGIEETMNLPKWGDHGREKRGTNRKVATRGEGNGGGGIRRMVTVNLSIRGRVGLPRKKT